MTPKTFGHFLRLRREQMTLTQGALAAKVGCFWSMVSKWERGVAYPNWPRCCKLADVLGVSLDYFRGK